jgi:hypothetical protein
MVNGQASEANPLNFSLGSVYMLDDVETFSVSPENPTGEKGKGGMAVPNPDDPDLPFSRQAEHLGQGWKVRPFIKLKPGEQVTIMDVNGPGIIQHIWMASNYNLKGFGRNCVLRFYWDNEDTPSIEVPFTDFFAIGHEIVSPVNSLPIVVNRSSGMNSYWPMPFRKHVRITFTNDDPEKGVDLLTYQITFAKTEVPENAAYLHAQWRRTQVDPEKPEHIILDNVHGSGKYVGTFMSYTQLHDGWFGEGEIKFFIDGDKKFPTINGTGTEDYFGASYGFPEVYSTPFLGNVLDHKSASKSDESTGPPKYSLYRWHIMDPIYFKKDLKITIQSLGWYGGKVRYRPLADDIATVAYWYQQEPHTKFPVLPSMFERWPR